MLLLLFGLPLIIGIFSLYLYQHNGKKEVFRLDLVQFLYGFVLFPVMFVWLKVFLFLLLEKELGLSLSIVEWFLLDTFFATVMLFVFGFEMIHILTKTFNLKYYRDPLYDVFEHSEYYHVWFSHIGMYLGLMLLFVMLAILNVLVPLEIESKLGGLLLIVAGGALAGALAFLGLWLSDSHETQFLRIMKLGVGVCFILLCGVYLGFSPGFEVAFGWFWFCFFAFFSMVVCSMMTQRSRKARSLANRFKHHKWDNRKLGDWASRWLK